MKIAIVYPSLGAVGGAENVTIWLAESLAKRGHSIMLFTRDFSEKVWGVIDNKPYKIHLLCFKKYLSTLKTNWAAGRALAAALSKSEFDVVIPHNYPANLWVYYAKNIIKKFPKILMFMEEPPRNFYEKITDVHYRQLSGLRNIWNQYRPKKILRRIRQSLFGYRRLDREAVYACDKVLANSEYTSEVARKIYRIDVIACPLGISLERFSNSKEIENNSHNGGAHKPFILTVTRIELAKNLDTILKAVRVLKNDGQVPVGFRYKIAGKGPHLEYFHKKCQRYGLDDIVEFLGFVPEEDLQQLYRESLFLVHIPLDEPFGLVPLEAALFKKTSIVSDHGGPAENVINGITGIYVNALDPRDVAEKMKNLWIRPELAKKMGEEAYFHVLRNATWDMFVDKFEANIKKPSLYS